jgi:hypothetical protein
MAANITATNASCNTCNNGIMNVTVTNGTAPYTYAWTTTAGNASTATGLNPGCYTVTVTDSQSCSVSGVGCLGLATGINEATSPELSIYPNPVNENLNLHYSVPGFKYFVYNNLGQVILQGEGNSEKTDIEFRNVRNGIYFIEVKTGDSLARRKIIVERN